MKWIGQHIWDFISRFRSDVYLEGTDSGTIASGGNLGLDSDNKIVKSASPSGTIDLTSEVTGTLPVGNGGTGATSLTDNSVLTGTGASPITAEANFTFDGNNMSLTALTSTFTNAVNSQVIIKNTGANTSGGVLDFINERGTGVDGDDAGLIRFYSDDDGGTATKVGELLVEISETGDGSEYGSLRARILSGGQQIREGLALISTAGNDIVNANVGYGSTSLTTIAGDLDIDGDNMTSAGAMTFTPVGLYTITAPDLTGDVFHLDADADTDNIVNIDAGVLDIDATSTATITTAGLTKFEAAGVEIENGSATGAAALLIDNDDVDQIALDIDAANTTANIIDITCPGVNGSYAKAINIDIDDAGVTGVTRGLMAIDYDKSGITATGQSTRITGLGVDLYDSAENVGSVTMTALDIDVDYSDSVGTEGTTTGFGAKIDVTDADTNVGIALTVEDGGTDIKCISSADPNDYFSIATTASGATTLTTEDGGAAAANLQITADGTAEVAGTTVTLDSAANIELEVGATSNYVQTTGILRGGNIGPISDTFIPIMPIDFMLSSSFRYPPIISLGGAAVAPSSGGADYYAQKIIPAGYTASACVIKGVDSDGDAVMRCYVTDLDGTAASAVSGAASLSGGAYTMAFSSTIVGDGEKICTIFFNPGDATDIIYGGKITIAKTV